MKTKARAVLTGRPARAPASKGDGIGDHRNMGDMKRWLERAVLDDPEFRNRLGGAGGAFAGKATLASAASLTIPDGVVLVELTGSTTVTSITASDEGRIIVINAPSTVTISDGSNLKLNGAFAGGAGGDGTLTLICDGTNWLELASSGNG